MFRPRESTLISCVSAVISDVTDRKGHPAQEYAIFVSVG